jgi:Flp pilus assembly protein TadG
VSRRPARESRSAERGIVTVAVALLLVPLILLAGLGIDVGQMMIARGQLQNATDAAAMAAMGALRDTGSFAQARQQASDVARAHIVGGQPLDIETSDVTFGEFTFSNRSFSGGSGGGGSTAVQVQAGRGIDLAFGPLLGRTRSNLDTLAVATLGKRELVLVQDATGSFFEEIEDARDADHALLARMGEQGFAGDEFGLVEFEVASVVLHELESIATHLSSMHSAIDDITLCRPGPCRGTNVAVGLEDAIEMLENSTETSAQVIVLVSDGVPCAPGNTAETRRREQAALDAAQAAEDAGISIFTVFLDAPGAGQCSGVSQGNPNLMRQLARGFGAFYSTPDSEDLEAILVSIIGQMPIRLVR